MGRTQRLVYSGLLAFAMAAHLTASRLGVATFADASPLAMVGIGVSVLVLAGALAIFLKSIAAKPDGQAFFQGDDDARRRSRRRAVGLMTVIVASTILLAILMRFLGVDSFNVSSFGDTLNAVVFPLFGSVVLVGMLRKGSSSRSGGAGSRDPLVR